MDTELIVAIITGVMALGATLIAARTQAQFAKLRVEEERRQESEAAAAIYREPLARSAFDLQSRLFNILEKGLATRFLTSGVERERQYFVDNTAFVIAEYLAWTELIRTGIQFIDLGEDERTRELARLQGDISKVLRTRTLGPMMHLFTGEQRAIGERMIQDHTAGPVCVGYARFLEQVADEPDAHVDVLRADLALLSTKLDDARPRLVALQHSLIDLLDFLDPERVRFPRDQRRKVPS